MGNSLINTNNRMIIINQVKVIINIYKGIRILRSHTNVSLGGLTDDNFHCRTKHTANGRNDPLYMDILVNWFCGKRNATAA